MEQITGFLHLLLFFFTAPGVLAGEFCSNDEYCAYDCCGSGDDTHCCGVPAGWVALWVAGGLASVAGSILMCYCCCCRTPSVTVVNAASTPAVTVVTNNNNNNSTANSAATASAFGHSFGMPGYGYDQPTGSARQPLVTSQWEQGS